MNVTLSCLPDWYCRLYFEGKDSATLTFLAALQWAARLFFLPIQMSIDEILELDTRLIEILAILSEICFVVWMFVGADTSTARRAAVALMDPYYWITIGIVVFMTHLLLFRSGDSVLRSIGMVWATAWWFVMAWAYWHSGGLLSSHVFLLPLIVGGVLSVVSLHRVGGDNGVERLE